MHLEKEQNLAKDLTGNTKKRILYLTIQKKWFDEIEAERKTEEYRSIKPYWIKRLMYGYEKGWGQAIPERDEFLRQMEAPCETSAGTTAFDIFKRQFDAVCFARGGHFHKSIPQMTVELKGIKINTGFGDWGAEPFEQYFVIQLGKILETSK